MCFSVKAVIYQFVSDYCHTLNSATTFILTDFIKVKKKN